MDLLEAKQVSWKTYQENYVPGNNGDCNMASSIKHSWQSDKAKAIQAELLQGFRDKLKAAQETADIKAVDDEARGALEALLARTEALETGLAALKEQVSSGVSANQSSDDGVSHKHSFTAKFLKNKTD